MNERPIIFSAESVRAILDGRKSQTRRVVKAPKWSMPGRAGVDFGGPYEIGQRLWVRETWFIPFGGDPSDILFRADGVSGIHDWRPSIFMPRWASRITLEITDVRVERLQEISAKDVEAEGIDVVSKLPHPLSLTSKKSRENLDGLVLTIARGLCGNLWDALNAKRGFGWDINPWVFVISFKRIKEGRTT